ncbi:MAG: hypothetical protein DCC75_00795 [Proteobacteria bacterium]|nr:MAG: hypothetical protein DCC75_00795 [Pseudomonadota bacterium]
MACKLLIALAPVTLSIQLAVSQPLPPSQPASGPGSSEYSHASVTWTQLGSAAEAVSVFEPADPAPDSAALVIFLHGYGGVNPQVYGGWIRHLVRRGNIVIFPVYQNSLLNAVSYTSNALTGIQTALSFLQSGGRVQPDLSKVVLIGHSLGGVIAANLATRSLSFTPLALFLANPADTNASSPSLTPILEEISLLPKELRLLAIVGNDDTLAGDTTARNIYLGAMQVRAKNRRLLTLFSDSYSSPEISADHNAPLSLDATFDSGFNLLGSGGQVSAADSMDFYGYWRFLDGLLEAAFLGGSSSYPPDPAGPVSMTSWSDGTAVQPALLEALTPLAIASFTSKVKARKKTRIYLRFNSALLEQSLSSGIVRVTKGSKPIPVKTILSDGQLIIRPLAKGGWPKRGRLTVEISAGLAAQGGVELEDNSIVTVRIKKQS